jgi:hypothetical protein
MADLNEIQAKIINYLVSNYEPADKPTAESLTYTTDYLYKQVDQAFPEAFSKQDLVLSLTEFGFEIGELNLKFYWLMVRK